MTLLVKLLSVGSLFVVNCFAYEVFTPDYEVLYQGQLLESPHWCPIKKEMCFVDIRAQHVNCYDEDTGNVTTIEIKFGPVSFVTTVEDMPDTLLISSRTGLFFLNRTAAETGRDTEKMKLFSMVDLGLPDNKFDDAKTDPRGRLFAGTMANESESDTVCADKGALYMFDEGNFRYPEVKIKPVSVSNGMAWSKDNKTYFYIDSLTLSVAAMNYDVETSYISNSTILFNLTANNITGFPDGMTIDTDDNLWVACYKAGMIAKVNSTSGELLAQYIMPVSKPTSVAWGGSDMSTLYVTSSNVGLTDEELENEPYAGGLFAIKDTGSKGFPIPKFKAPRIFTQTGCDCGCS